MAPWATTRTVPKTTHPHRITQRSALFQTTHQRATIRIPKTRCDYSVAKTNIREIKENQRRKRSQTTHTQINQYHQGLTQQNEQNRKRTNPKQPQINQKHIRNAQERHRNR